MPTSKTTPKPKSQLVRFDWAMKSILRNKANFDILEGFLQALLGEPITIEQILEGESNTHEMLKFNRVDLLVHDSKGRKLIIEIQTAPEAHYLQHLLFGTCKVIIDNLDLGTSYSQIVKVISISILYFNLGIGDDYVYIGNTEFIGLHTKKVLKRRKKSSKLSEPLPNTSNTPNIQNTPNTPNTPNIFPVYYLINVERFKDQIQDYLDEWIYLFKHSATQENFNAPNIDKAAHKLDILHMKKEERRNYENYVKSLVIEQDVLETARLKGVAEGEAKGLAEGEAKGLAEGEAKGKAEGKIELLARLLTRRFGELPDWAMVEIENADLVKLETWASKIFDAKNIEELLK